MPVNGTDILNKGVSSLIQADQTNNEVNLAKSLDTTNNTETQKFIATNEKLFANAATSTVRKGKSFSVYETKQVVKEVITKTPVKEDTKMRSVDDAKLASLSNHTGMTITSDSDIEEATNLQLEEMKSIASKKFSSAGDSRFTYDVKALSSITPNDPSTWINPDTGLPSTSNVWIDPDTGLPSTSTTLEKQNYTDDVSIRAYIPDTVSPTDFSSLQELVNGDLKDFNVCPDLSAILNFNNSLFDINGMFSGLLSLMGLSGKYNLSALLNCLSTITSQFSFTQQGEIFDTLKSSANVSGISSMLDSVPSSMVIDTKKTMLDINTNSVPTLTAGSKRPVNSWKNPDVVTETDTLLVKLGVDKTEIFESSRTKNPSITDTIAVVDSKALSNSKLGFGDYCLGAKAKLLNSIPQKEMFA